MDNNVWWRPGPTEAKGSQISRPVHLRVVGVSQRLNQSITLIVVTIRVDSESSR